MIWTDCVIISIIIFSSLVSLMRGFVREVLSLVTWVCAFFFANHYYSYLEIYFTSFKEQTVRSGIAIILLFVAILIVGEIISYVITLLIEQAGLSGINRIVGICFGALRGILIILTLLFFSDTSTVFLHFQDWQQSQLIPQFRGVIRWLSEVLSDGYSTYLQSTLSFLEAVIVPIKLIKK